MGIQVYGKRNLWNLKKRKEGKKGKEGKIETIK